MTTTVLIVDDDANVGRSVSMVLARRGMTAHVAAPSDWSRTLSEEVDVVLLDLYLGAVKGQNILERLLAEHPLVPVVIMSGVASAEEAVDCVRRGAFDYLEKPLAAERLAITVANAARFRRVRLAALADSVPVFASQSMRALAEDATQGGGDRFRGADHRRKRHRQGGHGTLHPRTVAAQRAAAGQGGLRRPARRA